MCLGHLLRHREPEELSSFIEHLTTECMSFTPHSESLVLKPSSFYSQLVKLSRVIFSFLSSSLLELDRSATMQNRRFSWKTRDKNNVSKYAYRDSLIADI